MASENLLAVEEGQAIMTLEAVGCQIVPVDVFRVEFACVTVTVHDLRTQK